MTLTYVLAKYTLLFLLAVISGFFLGRWMTRRTFVDVSESYESLRLAAAQSDTAHWDKLWRRLDALPEPKEINLSNINDRIDGLAYAVTNLPVPSPVSFASIESRLDMLGDAVSSISIPEPQSVDLEPVREQLGSLEQRVQAMSIAQTMNLAPVNERLKAIEVDLSDLGKRFVTPPTTQTSPIKTASSEPTILRAALYGDQDNLRLISGVGPKLEKLLNRNGVFYFWQVASWSDRDIELIDERLDTFRGRISRDNWVMQAKRLRSDPNAAQQPPELQVSA